MTYAAKILKAEARIDWRTAAVDIARQVNGLAPYPGAWFDLNGERVRILRAHHSCGTGQDAPGTVCTSEGLTIACGDGNRLRVTMLQRAGKSALDADTFLRGRPIAPGTVLSCPATD
jgi:methionyl-tRNA formyltransferase